MTPQEVKDSRSLVVDIRPREERLEVGYLPGSISVEVGDVLENELLVELKSGESVVLFCTTGRRSADLFRRLAPSFPEPLGHLEGGVLRWRAEGLPVCGLLSPQPDSFIGEVRTLDAFTKTLRSCFVAEIVERSLSDPRAESIDPVALLRQCFIDEGLDIEHPSLERMDRVLDRMGLMSKRMGTQLETIAENTDRMAAVLKQLDQAVR